MKYKKIGILVLLFSVVILLSFSSGRSSSFSPEAQTPSPREQAVHQVLMQQMQTFREFVQDSLLLATTAKQVNTQQLQQVFLQARLRFKKFEWASEFFAADLSKRLNGPPVEEVDNADLLDPVYAQGVAPVGMQVMEEFIFPSYDPAQQLALVQEIERLLTNTDHLIAYFTDLPLADWRILDAAKLEVFRLISLGITGYDNPLSLHSMQESAVALQSMIAVLQHYADPKQHQTLFSNLDSAKIYLQRNTDFDHFDRAFFIRRYANPISTELTKLAAELPGPKVKYNRMLRQDAPTLFAENAFNPEAFSPGAGFEENPAKVILGEKLFYDKALSGTGTRSCASCHHPDMAFTDGLVKQPHIQYPDRLLQRNTPTLLNVALQSNYFYDMRALTLEDQVRDVLESEAEMAGSMDSVERYVQGDSLYQTLFTEAFSGSPQLKPSDQIANALASYLRSLTQLNSRFDSYMRGEDQALSPEEIKGFNLFMGKAKCATCHFAPLFNGLTPPKFVQSEVEVLGVPVSLQDSSLDADMGYYRTIGVDSYKHAFKIPTVRNIQKTAPYMHNGIYADLDEVMEFYNNAGAVGLGIELPNQTLPDEPLNLSEEEKKAIIAFMESLESGG